MLTCRHCGWDNPEEAAFCTNCGRGLSRGRGGERPTESGVRFRALADSAPPPSAPPASEPPGAEAIPAPASARRPISGPPAGVMSSASELPVPPVDAHAATAPASERPAPPMPRLSAPAAQAESAPTLLDFRLPSDMLAELARARREAPATVEEAPAPARVRCPAPSTRPSSPTSSSPSGR